MKLVGAGGLIVEKDVLVDLGMEQIPNSVGGRVSITVAEVAGPFEADTRASRRSWLHYG